MSSRIVFMIAASVVGSSAEVGSSSNENRRVLQEGARDPDALPLAHAEVSAAFAHRAFVALRHVPDELVRLRALRRFDDFLLGRVGPAIGDVLADRG